MSSKITYPLIGTILIGIIGFSTYTHLGGGEFNVEQIKTELSGKSLTIDTKLIQEEKSEKYDYYQLYIYPENYTLKCTQNNSICSGIISHKERLKDYTLKFIGKDLKVSSVDDIVFDFNFANYKIKKHLLTSMFEDLFVRENNVENPKTIAQEICEDTIKSSLLSGGDDGELKARINSECQGTDIIGDLSFAFGGLEGENIKQKSIKLNVSIETMRLVYKFFIKQDGKYIEKEIQEKIIENPLELEASIDLSGF